MLIETKTYTDGTRATGAAPMPDLSPRQQEFVGMLDDVLESLRRGRVALEWSNQLDQVANVVRSMDQVREAIARIKCTPEQPAAAGVSDEEILTEAARHLGEMHVENCGLDDIKAFARAILALRPQSPKAGADVASTWSAAGGWVPMCEHAATDRHYTGSLETLRRFAELLRPQAVPTLDLEAACIGYARLDGNEYKLASMRRNHVMDDGQLHPIYTFSDEVAEAHHGITAQGAQGGEANHG